MMKRISFLLFCGILNNAEAQVSSPYSPEGEITQSFLSSRTFDVSRPVGVVAGSPSVSATGGAAYSVPLVAAPGTNGVQPQLGLVYNSQCGDGALG